MVILAIEVIKFFVCILPDGSVKSFIQVPKTQCFSQTVLLFWTFLDPRLAPSDFEIVAKIMRSLLKWCVSLLHQPAKHGW